MVRWVKISIFLHIMFTLQVHLLIVLDNSIIDNANCDRENKLYVIVIEDMLKLYNQINDIWNKYFCERVLRKFELCVDISIELNVIRKCMRILLEIYYACNEGSG